MNLQNSTTCPLKKKNHKAEDKISSYYDPSIQNINECSQFVSQNWVLGTKVVDRPTALTSLCVPAGLTSPATAHVLQSVNDVIAFD